MLRVHRPVFLMLDCWSPPLAFQLLKQSAMPTALMDLRWWNWLLAAVGLWVIGGGIAFISNDNDLAVSVRLLCRTAAFVCLAIGAAKLFLSV